MTKPVLQRPLEPELHTSVRVMDQSLVGIPCPERVESDAAVQGTRHLPPDDVTGEDIDDECDVGEARPGTYVGQVGDPETVRCRCSEVAVHQIQWPLSDVVRHRAPFGFPSHYSLESQLPHQPFHRAARHRDALSAQLPPELSNAVDAEVLGVDMPDLHFQGFVTDP